MATYAVDYVQDDASVAQTTIQACDRYAAWDAAVARGLRVVRVARVVG